MKTALRLLALSLILTAGRLPAAASVSAAPASGNQERELAALERFLDLSDEELDQMQRAITLIRAMGPEEKAALRQRMESYRRLPVDQRQQLRHGWGALEADLQDAWRRMMHAATPERRAEIQRQLQALPPEKKADYRRQLAEEFLGQATKR